jgi:hypothetical protein
MPWFERRFSEEQFKQRGPFIEAVGEALADTRHKVRKEFEPKFAALKKQVKQLEQQSSLDSRFFDLGLRLDARQQARDQAKRGLQGLKGEKGEPGPPAEQPVIVGWKVDLKNFRAVPFGADGKPLPELNLRPLAQAVVDAVGDMVGDVVREELERLLRQRAIGGW